MNYQHIAADAFGNALGNSIVDGLAAKPGGSGLRPSRGAASWGPQFSMASDIPADTGWSEQTSAAEQEGQRLFDALREANAQYGAGPNRYGAGLGNDVFYANNSLGGLPFDTMNDGYDGGDDTQLKQRKILCFTCSAQYQCGFSSKKA